jgi:hypothetical protein
MNLQKRIEQLEQRAGGGTDFILWIVALVECDAAEIGPKRVIERQVTGYSAMGRSRTWRPEKGESLEALRARIESELRAEGHNAYAVCESYSEWQD